MKAKIITLLLLLCMSLPVIAQEEGGKQILVFRNSGEINVFNSDSISRIELSAFDADSIEHSDYISQVFYHKTQDPMIIPLAEIDSVAFGVRNIIEPKRGVRRLTDEEVDGISSFDGDILVYDSRLNLTTGETVYYDRVTDILPCGLCIKVINTNNNGNVRKAEVHMCEPSEVFDRYLITGDEIEERMSKVRKANDYNNKPFEIKFPETNINGYTIAGSIKGGLNLDMEDVVIDIIEHYYHANIKLSAVLSMNFTVVSEKKCEVDYETPRRLEFSFPFLGGALRADVALDGFMDLNAEAGVEYNFNQEYFTSVEWTRRNGENFFSEPQTHKNNLGDMEQTMEVHLDGDVFLGPRLDISLNTALNLAGAGIEMKFGPKLGAEFSIGVLNELTDHYEQEAYGKAHVDVSLGTKTETYYYLRNLKNPKVVDKIKLPFESELFMDLFSINLLPKFHTKAVLGKETLPVVQTSDASDAISVSTFTETELPYPLDVDFEIADKESDETLAEIKVEELLEKDMKEVQNLSGEIVIPEEFGKIDKDNVVARPIINYKGYRVKATPVNVAADMVFTPMIASFYGGGNYFVSGMTPVSQIKIEDTTYIEGNLIGLQNGDPRHNKKTFTTIEFIDLSDLSNSGHGGYTHPLIGEWTGELEGENVTFRFIDSANGEYNGVPFTYRYNAPLQGGVAIKLESGGTISFSILDISEESINIVMRGANSSTTLYKK